MAYNKQHESLLSKLWEQHNAITIGGRSLSYSPPFGDYIKLDIEIKFVPEERLIISRTTSSQKSSSSFEVLHLPNDIDNANALITYVLKSEMGPCMGFGYELGPLLEDKLNKVLNNTND